MKYFTVVVTLVAECCSEPHLFMQTVEAEDMKSAIRKVTNENGLTEDAAEFVVFKGYIRGEMFTKEDLK